MAPHLSIFGFAKMPVLGNFLAIILPSLIFILLSQEYVQAVSFMLIMALAPTFVSKVQYSRKFKIFANEISTDKVLIFCLIMLIDYLSADYLRIIILALVLIILTNTPFLKYNLLKDEIMPIAAKILTIIVFSVFFTMMLNLGILILALLGTN